MHDTVLNPGSGTPLTPEERATALRRAWIGYTAMVFGNFMAILDIQIVASSLNEIQAGLSASADEIAWVQTAYLIAEVIAIPLSGYLSRMLSTRVFYTICALGFSLASLACAMAWNIESMIVFRVIQGFLGGGMIPTTMAALMMLFPPEKRMLPTVLVGMVSTMGPSLGPTLGGYLTATLSWHWMFLINLVPGPIIALTVWNVLRVDKPDPSLWRLLDVSGLVLMALFLGSLEFVLDEGPRHDWLQDDTVALFSAVTLVAGALFFWRSFTSANPIVNLRVFANGNFASGCIIAFVVGFSMYGMVYLLPLYLGRVRGFNSEQIGHVMMVMGLAMFFSAPFVGRLLRALDARVMVGGGMLVAAIGVWLNAHMTAETGFDQLVLPQLLRGAGIICCMISMTQIALGTLPADEVKNASGIFNLMRNVGGAIGLALLNTGISERYSFHWAHLSESISMSRAPVREALSGTSSALSPELGGDASAGALALIAQRVHQQALTMTFNDLMWLLSLMMLATLLLLPFIRKSEVSAAAAAEAH